MADSRRETAFHPGPFATNSATADLCGRGWLRPLMSPGKTRVYQRIHIRGQLHPFASIPEAPDPYQLFRFMCRLLSIEKEGRHGRVKFYSSRVGSRMGVC